MNIYIGQNIKRLRQGRQITQEQLSVSMGVSCAAVSKWERGETLPDISGDGNNFGKPYIKRPGNPERVWERKGEWK